MLEGQVWSTHDPGFTFGKAYVTIVWHLAKCQMPIWPEEKVKAKLVLQFLFTLAGIAVPFAA